MLAVPDIAVGVVVTVTVVPVDVALHPELVVMNTV
jgi:hypothetical protein